MIFERLRRPARNAPDAALVVRQAYASFRRLLGRNGELLSLFADLETDLRYLEPGDPVVRARVLHILSTTLDIVQDLTELQQGGGAPLFAAYERLEAAVQAELRATATRPEPRLAIALDDPEAVLPDRVGGKAANLARLRRFLRAAVPDGFAVTTAAYQALADAAGVGPAMRAMLGAGGDDEARLVAGAAELRGRIERTPLPGDLARAIEAQAARFPGVQRWAVRSSGVGEDGRYSFAGQFDTRLAVATADLAEAWRGVAASRFADRALAYRQALGFSEVETPMAVLCLPMIEAASAGVLYTRDPDRPEAPVMWITSAFGLASEAVAGRARADLFIVARDPCGALRDQQVADKDIEVVPGEASGSVTSRAVAADRRRTPSLDVDGIARLARLGLAVERYLGGPQDIEWVRDREGSVWLLQARPLTLGTRGPAVMLERPESYVVKLRGQPLAPGRAVGPAWCAPGVAELDAVPEGAVLVVAQATPELARVLPRIAAVVAESGSRQSHAAALLRQADIPAVSEATGALSRLGDGEPVGVDGGRGEVYAGTPWPELERRARRARATQAGGALYDRVLQLSLIDPDAPSFKPTGCRSIHDLVRLVHEQALAAMFGLGDRQARGARRSAPTLRSPVPLNLRVLDLGGGVAAEASGSGVAPEAIRSAPFQAFWRGAADARLSWAGRRDVSASGFFSVVQNAMFEQAAGMRRLGDANYLFVAPDYMNLNARLAYHYAMLDAAVGDLAANNYVAFRFVGGGAGRARRDLRALFLTDVLTRLGFAVDCHGDLVNAWLRATPRGVSEDGLVHLGRLMACARQLDMLLGDETRARTYARQFLEEDYSPFA